MAKSQYIRPDELEGIEQWNGFCRLDQNHVGRIILKRSEDYDPTFTDKPDTQLFGTLTFRQYKKDGENLMKKGHTVNLYATLYADDQRGTTYKSITSGILPVGEFNHKFKLKYMQPNAQARLPAAFSYDLHSTKQSNETSTSTMEV